MDFQQLLAKMKEIDQPAVAPQVDTPVGEECGMPMTPPMPEKDHQPPSMSVNINAQGMDDISELMKLLTKVNPDMMPKGPEAMPSLDMPPAITAIKPAMPPLKMLPDLDMDDDPGHPEPDADNFGGPSDNDADNKPGDADDDEEKKKEEFANEPDEEYKSADYMNNQLAGGMNRPKKTYQRVSPGDNPMAFRESIRQELLNRLAEAKSKGAK